jgi:hypothetical protein
MTLVANHQKVILHIPMQRSSSEMRFSVKNAFKTKLSEAVSHAVAKHGDFYIPTFEG